MDKNKKKGIINESLDNIKVIKSLNGEKIFI